MDACARDLADRVQSLERRAAAEVGHDTAHHVVRRGCDRYEIAARVDAACHADGKDAGEALREILAQLARVEVDAPLPLLAKDGTGDDVARRELGELMTLHHEALAGVVHENGSFAADGFGDQLQRILRRIQRGRMKLHELHIGESSAGAMSNCETVAGRDNGIGRVTKNLAATTRRQDSHIRDDLGGAASDAGAHADAFVTSDDEVEHAGLLDNADALALVDAIDERARDLGARLIAMRVDDTILRMRCLASELEIARRIEVERGTGGLKLAHSLPAFFDEHLYRRRVTQCRTVGEC